MTKVKILLLKAFVILFTSSLAQGQVMKMHVINVGQGSSTLLEFACGVVLIDAGGENNQQFRSTEILTDYLDNFFEKRTDLNKTIHLLIVSHPHIDHTLGLKELAQNYKIKNVVTNGQEYGSGRYQQAALHKIIADAEATSVSSDDIGYYEAVLSNIPVTGITNSVIDPVNCAGANPTIKLLWGRVSADPGWGKDRSGRPNFDNNNNHSVVTRVDFGEASILFTGDLELEAIHDLVNKYNGTAMLDTDVYVVGHHGSRNGTSVDLLEAITPEIAVISFGDPEREDYWTAWAYGHPNIDIVNMLNANCTATRTPKEVLVGNGAKNFSYHTISKGIYGTGWDDHIMLEATLAGTWKYIDPNTSTKININTATAQELTSLPSIGSSRAQAIVNYRRNRGSFANIDDLINVPGIGPATLARIRELIQL
jgi:competence protein ComEC